MSLTVKQSARQVLVEAPPDRSVEELEEMTLQEARAVQKKATGVRT